MEGYEGMPSENMEFVILCLLLGRLSGVGGKRNAETDCDYLSSKVDATLCTGIWMCQEYGCHHDGTGKSPVYKGLTVTRNPDFCT